MVVLRNTLSKSFKDNIAWNTNLASLDTGIPIPFNFIKNHAKRGWRRIQEDPGFSSINEKSRALINAIKRVSLQGSLSIEELYITFDFKDRILKVENINHVVEAVYNMTMTGLLTILFARRMQVKAVFPQGRSSDLCEVAKFTALQDEHTGARTASNSPHFPCRTSQIQSLGSRNLFYSGWGFEWNYHHHYDYH